MVNRAKTEINIHLFSLVHDFPFVASYLLFSNMTEFNYGYYHIQRAHRHIIKSLWVGSIIALIYDVASKKEGVDLCESFWSTSQL